MSKSDRLPIWLRPEPGDRKPRFSRDQIAEAALAIADAQGFEAVSMREVAARLGAGTMTLYHYVRTKDDLIALMDDALMAEVLVPERELPRGWREKLAVIARRTRAIYERHPWALIAMQGARLGPNGMRHFEQCLAALADTSLDANAKLELLGLIDDFVFGHALRSGEEREQRERSHAEGDAWLEFGRRQLQSGDYPETASLFGAASAREASERFQAALSQEKRFERGLEMLLDGAAKHMRAPRAARRKRRQKRST